MSENYNQVDVDRLLTEEYRIQAELDNVHARLELILGTKAVAAEVERPRYRAYGNLIVLTPRLEEPEGIA